MQIFLQNIRTNVPTIVIGMVAFTAVALGYVYTCTIAEDHARSEYTQECDRVADRVSTKFDNYATSLDAARAFVLAAGEPDREAWKQFTSQSKLIEHNPGIFGLAYVKRVQQDKLADFVRTQVADGYKDFQIKQPQDADLTPGEFRYIIAHHEPASINIEAIGLDLASRSVNKSVYDKAAMSGKPSLSNGITLAQEVAPNRGLVMALPVYTNLASDHNIDSVMGWVAVPIGMHAFFDDPSLYSAQQLRLHIREDGSNGNLLHSTASIDSDAAYDNPHPQHTTTAAFGGKRLHITFAPAGPTSFPVDLSRPRLVLVIGSFFSLALIAITYYTHRTRRTMANRLIRAVNNAQIGVWEWDLNRNTFRFSDSYAHMLGFEPDELNISYNSWDSFCHPDDIAAEREDIDKYLAGESEVYINEHRIRTKNGSWLWVRDIGEIIEWNHDGTPKKLLGVHIDIQSQRNAMEKANQADIAKNEFLTNMSHEIRTPLTAIMGYVEILKDEPENRESLIHTVLDNADLLLTIINDILDMSKIESGKLYIETVSCDPVQITQSVTDALRVNAKQKELSLAIILDSPIPSLIQSDPTRLRQILFNLVGNAIKFTPSGSVSIHIKHFVASNTIEFRVADTGIGMDADQVDRLIEFHPFTQGNTSTTREFGGSGLGLSIASSMTSLLGGNLDFSSSRDNGSVFFFDIPTGPVFAVSRYEPEIRAASLSAFSGCTKDRKALSCLVGKQIMIVDDGEDNRKLLRHHLEKAGAEVDEHVNGQECIRDIFARPYTDLPDLLVLDIQMPVMDGLQTIEMLKQRGIELPTLALTAHAGIQHQNQCRQAGFSGYMTKPFSAADLITKCRQTLETNQDQRKAA